MVGDVTITFSMGWDHMGPLTPNFSFSKCIGKLFGDLQNLKNNLQMNLMIFFLTFPFV